MKHVSTFTKEELQQICQIIGPKVIKSQFQKNPKEFAKIRPGFRATSLSDDEALSLVLRNSNNRFIADLVHTAVEHWLSEIDSCRQEAQAQGATPEEALVRVLSKSLFDNNVPLYFAISEEERSPEFISVVQAAVNLQLQLDHQPVVAEQTSSEEPTHQPTDNLQEQITALEHELSASQEQLRTVTAERAKATEEIDELKQAVTDAETRYSAMVSRESDLQAELAHYHKMERYADTEPEYTPTEEYPYVSLCQVYINSMGNLALYRLADIEHGELIKFVRPEGRPSHFENREKLFWKDGPDEVGAIGVWQWNAIANRSDPSNDYVLTHFDQDRQAIEIVEFDDCSSLEDVAEKLTNQNIPTVEGRKLLIIGKITQGFLTGLLCNTKDFVVADDTMRLRSSILSLPQFEITLSDTIILAGRRFYRHTALGLPVGIYRIRHPLSIVREIILSRATSASLRMQGLSKKEAQHCQGFLKEMPIDSLIQEVADTCDCSPEEANEYVSQFIAQADSYLGDADLDIGTLSAAITRSTSLVERCKQLLTAEWEEENAEKRSAAQAQLDEVQAQVAAAQSSLSAMEDKKASALTEIDQLHQTIKAQEELAADVELRVAERINAARKNAAAFLTDMAFMYPHDMGTEKNTTQSMPTTESNFLVARRGASIKENYQISDSDDFFDELADNLNRVGYSKRSVNDYTQTIMFCIDNRMPLVCGHNAEVIADCIAAMFGTDGAYTATVPLATGDSCPICESINQQLALRDTPMVVLLNGVFDGYSNNAFSQIMQYSAVWGEKVILLIAIEGNDPASLPCALWNKTMFVDGDIGIDHLQSKELHAHCTDSIFGTDYSADIIHDKLKSINMFTGVISKTALLNIAKYLVFTDGSVEKDEMLQRQILRYGWSARQSDKIIEILNNMGIDASTIC